MIVDKKLGSGTYNGYSLLLTSGKAEFAVRDGVTKAATSTATYNDGTWHLLTGVKSGDNLYVYVDGALQDTETGVNSYNADTTQSLAIGARKTTPQYPYNGYIKDVRIYNKALSSSEITTIYNATK